jgi:hypothetical protein
MVKKEVKKAKKGVGGAAINKKRLIFQGVLA